MITQYVMDCINFFIAPISPFDLEDYTDFDIYNRRREKWFASLDQEELCLALTEILTKQVPSEWQYRDDMYRFEICEIGGLFRQTEHAHHLVERIVPLLGVPEKRQLVIQFLGNLGADECISYLEELPIADLSADELTDLAGSLGLIGGPLARRFLIRLKDDIHAGAPEVQQEISLALCDIDES